jgi:putative endonuclease
MTGVRRAFGAWGEQTAEAYLRGLGMVVIDRNWRCAEGELDLIALDGDVIVFCEQKLQDLRQANPPARGQSPEAANHSRVA